MGTIYVGLPVAPMCPAWCSEHDGRDSGWNIHPGAVTKTCRRLIDCDGDAQVELERFASVEDGVRIIEGATVRLRCDNPLTPRDALLLARTIARAVEMTSQPAITAA